MDEPLTITLSKAEALVLFELLAGFRDEPHLTIRNDAERVTLWLLEASLERVLAEPLSEDYDQVFVRARESVLAKWGLPPKA